MTKSGLLMGIGVVIAGCAAAENSRDPSSGAFDEHSTPLADAGVDANGDARTTTKSYTLVVGNCSGEALPCDAEDCGCQGIAVVDEGVTCSGSEPRPCDSYGDHEGACRAAPGCVWKTQETINEGTDSGRSCHGEPTACSEFRYLCPQGCVADGVQPCLGEPLPCGAFEHSIDCSAHEGCVWG